MKAMRWKIFPPKLPNEEPEWKSAVQESEAIGIVLEGVGGVVGHGYAAAFFNLGVTRKDGEGALERNLPLITDKPRLDVKANLCAFVRCPGAGPINRRHCYRFMARWKLDNCSVSFHIAEVSSGRIS